MADVHCPMCGKSNAQELDECQYCGARLKPVVPSTPAASQAMPGSDSSGALPDWLSGLGKAAADDEDIPDWLTGLRGENTSEASMPQAVEGEPVLELGNEDWMKRLGGSEPGQAASEPPAAEKIPDLQPPALESPALEQSPEPAPDSNLPDWMQNLQNPTPALQEPPVASTGGEKLPDWLSGLPDVTAENWPDLSETEQPFAKEKEPELLDRLDEQALTADSGTPAEAGELVPDWLSSLGSLSTAHGSTPGEEIPEWLSNLDTKPGPESGTPAALLGNEPMAASNVPAETPDWLSKLQADADASKAGEKHKEGLGDVSKTPVSPENSGSLPDWLAGIGSTALPSIAEPALIADNQGTPPAGESETVLPLEVPDWLSKINPDQGAEKEAGKKDDRTDSENIEAAELPSWVQALRPLEAVVESKTAALDENQITELSGPLTGLRGVLPAGPGLGLLRKPPAYSSKLQVSDGQQRYAASLEQLVAGETHPHVVKSLRQPSNRIWRWCIALLLFLAAGLPFASGVNFAPATLLLSSDKGASANIIDGLAETTPVLVAFDYDPALSGELEAVAAPLMDHMLNKGTPLALISTSPTGPALAENFLKTTSLVNVHQYQSGVQYVNLAGGPAGMSYLAYALPDAAPVSVDGKSAWKTGPLQGIQSLSNFAAVIILTDNADTGRNWIEQAGPRLGNTPMMMIISTQAEPMIRPYYDSGQLKGLISGMTDAKIYEQTFTRPGLATHYWNSFSVGMLVAELLIAAGAILGVMADRRGLRKDSKKEA
jgi:hypothetical protein